MNVLIMTVFYKNYRSDESSYTKAIHYLANRVAEQNRVIVMHNAINNAQWIKMLKHERIEMSSHEGSEVYTIDNVKVIRNNIINILPFYTVLSENSIRQAYKSTEQYLKEIDFVPDVVVVHFCFQQRQLVRYIARKYECPIIPVFHNIDVKHANYCKKCAKEYSYVGARSTRIKRVLINAGIDESNIFIVNSGYPGLSCGGETTNKKENSSSEKVLHELIFAGNLIGCKRVGDVLKALSELKNRWNFRFAIIGSGEEEKSLKKLCKELELQNIVRFLGRLERNETIEKMKASDCFIMVSKPETFGISYIEAMASGCFIIGSKGEGIDGIIIDGYNGLLAEPENINSIKSKIEQYFSMPNNEKDKMIENGYHTSKKYTESAVAKEYESNIKKALSR